MKKIIVCLMLFSLLILPIMKNTDASTNGIPLKDYQFSKSYIDKDKIQNYHYLKNIILLPENSFNELEALKIIERLGQINKGILKKLILSNVHVKLFSGKLTDQPSVMHLKGIKPRGYTLNGPTWDEVPGIGGSKLVLVRIGYSHTGMGHSSINLELHEVAHSIDRYVYDLIRNDVEFLKIWHHDVNILFPNQPYFTNYPEEYFAEVFAMYFLNDQYRSNLMNEVPLTYEYLKNLTNFKLEKTFLLGFTN